MGNIISSVQNNYFKISFVILLVAAAIIYLEWDKKYYYNPDSYIIDQLANKKIIMLGDFGHGYPLPFKSLISLLNKWLDKIKSGDFKVNNIVLMLEDDTLEVNNIKDFVNTGNWKPLIDIGLLDRTLEWLEFCSDLRLLKLKKDALNAENKFSPKISFDIVGAESYTKSDFMQTLKFSEIESAKYFIYRRNSLTSKYF